MTFQRGVATRTRMLNAQGYLKKKFKFVLPVCMGYFPVNKAALEGLHSVSL